MEPTTNKYQLTLSLLHDEDGFTAPQKKLALEMSNHEELFQIIDKLKAKDPFGDKDNVAQFAIGLKMFSSVMVKHRNHPLFKEFSAAYRLFIIKLKTL